MMNHVDLEFLGSLRGCQITDEYQGWSSTQGCYHHSDQTPKVLVWSPAYDGTSLAKEKVGRLDTRTHHRAKDHFVLPTAASLKCQPGTKDKGCMQLSTSVTGLSMSSPKQGSQPRDSYTIGWVCALAVELTAAIKMLDVEHETTLVENSDDNIYSLGRIGIHNVVISCLPAGQTGVASAAVSTGQMMHSFPSIRFILLVGIGGGVPSIQADIRLGDVVVSHPDSQNGGVVSYDIGKAKPEGVFEPIGTLAAPPKLLLNALSKIKAIHMEDKAFDWKDPHVSGYLSELRKEVAIPDFLFKAESIHKGESGCISCTEPITRTPRDEKDVVVHYGTIASGSQVVKDGVKEIK